MKIEDYIFDKLYNLFQKLLSLKVKADIDIDEVLDLTEKVIDEIKNKYNIKGIVLDVDETLRYDMEPIDDDILNWLDMIQSKLKVVVISNGYDKTIEEELKKKDILYVPMAFKPFKKVTRSVVNNKMSLGTKDVMIVGDNVLDDIYMGNKLHMTTVKVKNKRRVK